MHKQRPFSKLKKIIDGLFDEKLKMGFCCISYPIRGQRGHYNSIPRYYLKLDKEILWDFPKDFEIKKQQFYWWADDNGIVDLVRNYIDTPVCELPEKEFNKARIRIPKYISTSGNDEIFEIDYKLTDIFKAADRRLGKDKLFQWAASVNITKVDWILALRFENHT